jgi:hypothetical protein
LTVTATLRRSAIGVFRASVFIFARGCGDSFGKVGRVRWIFGLAASRSLRDRSIRDCGHANRRRFPLAPRFNPQDRRCSNRKEEDDMSVPYRISNPPRGVTEVRRSEPPRAPGKTAAQPHGRFSAQVYFAAAEMLALDGHFRPALRAAERGMKLETPEPEGQALYAWLLYLCERRSTSQVSPAVWSQINGALALDSSCALAHYFKSVLLQRSGQAYEARSHLQRGRELDSNQSAADRAIALLDDE